MNYHVSPSGSDSYTGAQATPMRTLGKALELSRSQAGPRTITMHEGIYEDVSVALDNRDSGLTIGAEGRAVLVGGVKVSDWTACGDGSYRAALPEGVPADFRLIAVDGSLRERARVPEEGRLQYKSTFASRWISTTGGGWDVQPTEAELTTLAYDPKDIDKDFDWQNAEVTIFHKWDESMAGISAHDADRGEFTLSAPISHPPGAFGSKTYIIWNTKEGMARGKWRLDAQARTLYYAPLPGEDMASVEVYIPRHRAIIEIDGEVEGLTIEGLCFTVTSTPPTPCGFGAGHMPGAIDSFAVLRNCAFRNLSFTALSGWGIRLKSKKKLGYITKLGEPRPKYDGGNERVTVENCIVTDAGAGGIQLWGQDCLVRGNTVERVGRIYYSAIGIYALGCDIIGNELRDMPYSAIGSVGGDGLRINYNRIYNAVNMLNDGAGIYATFSIDSEMIGNAVYGVKQKYDEPDTTRNGLYLDEQTTGWLVEGNLTSGCASAMMNHMSRGNTLRNNAFVSQDGAVMLSFIRCQDYLVEKNAFQAKEEVTFAHRRDAFAAFEGNLTYSAASRVESIYVGDDYSRSEPEALNPFPD